MNKFLSLLSFLLILTISASTCHAASHEKKADDAIATEGNVDTKTKDDTTDATKDEMTEKKSAEAEPEEAVKKKKEAEEEEEPDCD